MAKFFIDAGHGGTETGAIGHGMIEKNINLTVAKELKRLLELNGQMVKMSRQSDVTLDLGSRCSMANDWMADLFVSVHHNANDGETTGSEVYCSVKGGIGKDYANSLSNTFVASGRKSKVVQKESEKVKGTDYYYVIAKTKMPSIIVEFGYMDSKDYINFDTDEELMQEALMIAKGLLKQVGISEVQVQEKSVIQFPHWAQSHYDGLLKKGIKINETRFDDKITRGEIFALLNQFIN
jgi:N-acetylmuramoyl-L-alanine amidase